LNLNSVQKYLKYGIAATFLAEKRIEAVKVDFGGINLEGLAEFI
jgi:hypothetical protein